MYSELERQRELVDAICATVVYADIFDCAVGEAELHRDLVYRESEPGETIAATSIALGSGLLARTDSRLTLPDRTHLAAVRRERERQAFRLWSIARAYGQLFAAIPFVRMVGVTGSLAADNPVRDADVDFLLVSTPRRLWLVRAAAIAVVRLARRRNVNLCPNYLLSTRALALGQHDLYTAHEVLQLVPTAGAATYRAFIAQNSWIARFLPNRSRKTRPIRPEPPVTRLVRSAAELLSSGPVGDRLNDWEGRRKSSRFREVDATATFSDDVCEGHFRRYRELVLERFADRCQRVGVNVAALATADGALVEPARAGLELVG